MGHRAFRVENIQELVMLSYEKAEEHYKQTEADAFMDYMDEIENSLIKRFLFHLNKGRYKLRQIKHIREDLTEISADLARLVTLHHLIEHAPSDSVVYLSGEDLYTINKYVIGEVL